MFPWLRIGAKTLYEHFGKGAKRIKVADSEWQVRRVDKASALASIHDIVAEGLASLGEIAVRFSASS
jgi:hypothetical protein